MLCLNDIQHRLLLLSSDEMRDTIQTIILQWHWFRLRTPALPAITLLQWIPADLLLPLPVTSRNMLCILHTLSGVARQDMYR